MKASTIKFLSLIVKENMFSLLKASSSLVDSVNDWVNTIEDDSEISETDPEAPEQQFIKVDKDKFEKFKIAYGEWISAHHFLDEFKFPDCPPKADVNYSLAGRIVALVDMVQSGYVSRELTEMLEYISTFNKKDHEV